MRRDSVRSVALAALVQVAAESENDQAKVAAARTLLEATGNLGARAIPIDETSEKRAIEMTRAELQREAKRLMQ